MPAFPILRRPLRAPASLALAVLSLALLSACSKPAPQAENVRPVRAIVAHASNVGVHAEFSGEVRARVESRLGFRVGGKITARKVDVGTVVKRGQVLMQLDPQDLRLSQAQTISGYINTLSWSTVSQNSINTTSSWTFT